MQNNEIMETLCKAAVRLPSSGVIMARVLSELKLQRILKKYGAGKPVLMIYGEPGNGKTSTVRTLLEKSSEVKFAEGLKEVKKTVKSLMDMKKGDDEKEKGNILFLDNFPEPLSDYKLESGRRILDYVIDIVSEDEKAPFVIITGEPNILGEVGKAASLIGRTLIIKMPKIDEDNELYKIRECFSVYRSEYLEQWEAYDRWTESNPPDETEILQRLREFRQKHCGRYENRQIGLVFCYYYAIHRFSTFLEMKYGMGIAIEDIEKNIHNLFDWKESSKRVRSSFEVDVWNAFVDDGGIRKVYMPREAVCQLLLESRCYEDPSYQCYFCEGDFCECYNPMDLRLPNDQAAAILISKPSLIPNFPKHVVCDSPLLMMRNTSLLEMLNTYLETYSRKKGVSVRRITPKKLTKELFANNLCLFEYVGTRHNAYTFRMKDVNNENVRVIFIKLTEKQHEELKANVKNNYHFKNYDSREVSEMNYCVKEFCENVQSLIGEIGTPSMLLDELN